MTQDVAKSLKDGMLRAGDAQQQRDCEKNMRRLARASHLATDNRPDAARALRSEALLTPSNISPYQRERIRVALAAAFPGARCDGFQEVDGGNPDLLGVGMTWADGSQYALIIRPGYPPEYVVAMFQDWRRYRHPRSHHGHQPASP